MIQVDGHFKVTCTRLASGQLVPDVVLFGGQDQSEHLTIPGIITFSDGTGTVSSVQGIDQVFGSLDILSGATARIGVGDISVELLSKSYDFGDLNGAQLNSDGLSGSIGGSASQEGGLGAVGTAEGIAHGLTSIGGSAGGFLFDGSSALASGVAGFSELNGGAGVGAAASAGSFSTAVNFLAAAPLTRMVPSRRRVNPFAEATPSIQRRAV